MLTPCQLEVLMHYYVSGHDHPRKEAPAVAEAITMFMQEGMLKFANDGVHITTTDKGSFWLEHLLSIPFPVKRFRIPKNPENEEGILYED